MVMLRWRSTTMSAPRRADNAPLPAFWQNLHSRHVHCASPAEGRDPVPLGRAAALRAVSMQRRSRRALRGWPCYDRPATPPLESRARTPWPSVCKS